MTSMTDATASFGTLHFGAAQLGDVRRTRLTGLGQIGNGKGRGYECHNTLAVHDPTRAVLGLANQILARRDTIGKGESREARHQRETRESRLTLCASPHDQAVSRFCGILAPCMG